MSSFKLSRRGFLKATGIVGGGLIIGYVALREGVKVPIKSIEGSLSVDAFIQITPANKVIFYLPRDEMGQGAYMGLSTLVAEELDTPIEDIIVEFAGVHEDYNNPDFGIQGTGGSTSIRVHYLPLRQAAANVRKLLLQAAASDLQVSETELSTEDTFIVHQSTRYPYAHFLETAARGKLPRSAQLKHPSQFKYIGKEIARNDASLKSTGTAVYGIDVQIPDAHYALVQRSPVVGGTIRSVDSTEATSVSGVTDIVEIENGIAVVADSFWPAKKALGLLKIEWDEPELSKVDSKKIRSDYQTALIKEAGNQNGDDVVTGMRLAHSTISREYWTPYLAHAPLEPMNAVVRIKDGEADVWSGTQGPSIAQGLVARYAGVPKEKVRVHSTFLGGGFGRRGVLSHIAEATQIAVAVKKTIKLVWTREHDIQNGWYRPASLMKINAGLDDSGKIIAWDATRVGGNITPDTLRFMLPGALPRVPKSVADRMAKTSESIFDGWAIDKVSIEGLADDYVFGSKAVRHVTVNHGLPLAYWRSVGHSFTAFAKESMIDELAEKAGISPFEFRTANLAPDSRLIGVLSNLKSGIEGWGIQPNRAIGVAAHSSFGSYVAQAAEVSIKDSEILVHRVFCSVDCGLVVNPDVVRAQMEGAIVFGLTAALYGEVELERGRIKQSNFHDYRMLRSDASPDIRVGIVESDEMPTGVGEPGLPPIAAAVANGLYRLTGRRLTSLPLSLS